MKGPRSVHQQRVDQFMLKARQELPGEAMVPDERTRQLRARLILEEALETVEALGFSVSGISRYPEPLLTVRDTPVHLESIIDGCCDLSVVTVGTLSACGVPDEPFLAEVDQNNLAKFGPGHSVRADGKLIKPPDHEPPDLSKVLKEVGEWG